MGHACRTYWPGRATKPVSPYSGPLPTAPCVSLSCWGDCCPCRDRYLMPGGRMVDQVWASFPVCWVGDVPGCAVAVWCGVEQLQPTFNSLLRLGHKHSSWECFAESGTTSTPWCVPALHWMKMQMCTVPLQGLEFCRKVIGAGGPKGTWATICPLPKGVTWDMRAWEFRHSLSPVLPQEIKIAPYLSQARWFLKSEPQEADLSTSTVHLLPLFVQQLRVGIAFMHVSKGVVGIKRRSH